jgi:nitrogen regulatory protein PII-like uncharacterized protein
MKNAGLGTESLVRLFKVLSKPDALEVFLLAGEGIKNSAYAIEELGVSSKKYYARLKDLVEMGLVSKKDGGYGQTPFGLFMCNKIIPTTNNAFKNKEKLKIISELGTSVDDKAKKEIIKILKDKGVVGFLEADYGISPIRMIEEYGSLVDELKSAIECAEKSVLLVTRYTDTRIADAGLRAMKRGVKIMTLSSDIESGIDKLRLALSPKTLMAFAYYFSNFESIGEISRVTPISFSFCVIDGLTCFFEFPSLDSERYSIGFTVKDESVGEKFTEEFNELWKKAKPNEILTLLTKLKGDR